MDYPIEILTQDETLETVVQVYLQNAYTTSGGTLTLITNNDKEFKNELFQNVAFELGIKKNALAFWKMPFISKSQC